MALACATTCSGTPAISATSAPCRSGGGRIDKLVAERAMFNRRDDDEIDSLRLPCDFSAAPSTRLYSDVTRSALAKQDSKRVIYQKKKKSFERVRTIGGRDGHRPQRDAMRRRRERRCKKKKKKKKTHGNGSGFVRYLFLKEVS
jgi:hypothetical protein